MRSSSLCCQPAVPLQPILAHPVDTHLCTWTDPVCHFNSAELVEIRLRSPCLPSHDDFLMQNETSKSFTINKNTPEKQ